MKQNRIKDWLAVAALLLLTVLLFRKILFTDLMVRAPDISSEFIWTVRHFPAMGLGELFRIQLHPVWDWLTNGGTTEGGGTISLQLLYYRSLLFWLLPLPTSIAWFMVLHLFFGGLGTYCYCRVIGLQPLAALGAGLLFALAPEQASLINAGHVQKIATISFAPWIFCCLEKGLLTRRLVWFLSASVLLALQFFNMHWQIAYYTCLALAVYGLGRLGADVWQAGTARWQTAWRLGGLQLLMLLFFLSTVAISLIPLADWSKETTRGIQSGANQGKGGLQVDEAMAWSLPPEELATFVVPGLFGFSRQEGAYDAQDIRAYYWGRMVFTQTSDYMGLLPWLVLPLVLLCRRDKYVWLMLSLMLGGILFSLGRYTPFYWWLYEHLPGVNHFRVPKMMLFVTSFAVAVLTGLGLQQLLDGRTAEDKRLKPYLTVSWGMVLFLVLCLGLVLATGTAALKLFTPLILEPSRFTAGPQLVQQRWNNLVIELGIAACFAVGYGLVIWGVVRRRLSGRLTICLLLLMLIVDIARVNNKFQILQQMPEQVQSQPTAVMQFLKGKMQGYRLLVLDGSDPMQYVVHELPVAYTSNPVQMQRWQDYLDILRLDSRLPDMMNIKYLVYPTKAFERDKGRLAKHYQPVFKSPDGTQVVLENRTVLPKAWLVEQIERVPAAADRLARLQSADFNPARIALVEQQPPLQLTQEATEQPGKVILQRFSPNVVRITVNNAANCLLVLGEKYYKGWHATVDGKSTPIVPVDHILRGVYLTPGNHAVEFRFDPLPFKIGKWLTLGSFALFVGVVIRELLLRRRRGDVQTG